MNNPCAAMPEALRFSFPPAGREPAATSLLCALRAGERQAARRLVDALTPSVRAGVAEELLLRRSRRGREPRQEVEDITQSVLLYLFANGARALLRWDPARGRELKSFVGLVARRVTAATLRSRRRSPWSDDPVLPEDLDEQNATPTAGPESSAVSRDMLAALTDRVRARLTARGVEMFEMLFLDERPTEDICALTGMAPHAVYRWRGRLSQMVKEIAAELG
jgi:hypothetical protein